MMELRVCVIVGVVVIVVVVILGSFWSFAIFSRCASQNIIQQAFHVT